MSLPTFLSTSLLTVAVATRYWQSYPNRYTSNVIVTDNGEISMGACPIQIIFCLKEQNKKKLNSHRWFFNAFGPLIKPNGACRVIYYRMILNKLPVCVLLDVGTKPTSTSIYELWKCRWDVFATFPWFHILHRLRHACERWRSLRRVRTIQSYLRNLNWRSVLNAGYVLTPAECATFSYEAP